MTIQSIEAELRRVERRREKLSRQLEDRKRKQFTSIPAKYGFKSMDSFIAALSPYTSPSLTKAKPKTVAKTSSTTAKTARRGKYSDQVKAAVKADLQKGDKTVREIAKQRGVSEYAIIDWKQAWGLVKHRKTAKKAAKKK